MAQSESASYYSTRYRADPNRGAVWRHICTFLEGWIPQGSHVLELGAGYGDFSNALRDRHVTAMDIDPALPQRVAAGVRAEVGDCSDLTRFDNDSFDVVFASNLLEHMDRPATGQLLAGALQILRPSGRLILMQPNFRLRPREYFDDYTHVSIHTDRSLPDLLKASGFEVSRVIPGFLPLTMNSRFSGLTFLVPLYLRMPIKPLAGQMLVIANRPAGR